MVEQISIDEILLRRKNKLTIEKDPTAAEDHVPEKELILSIMKNIESLGFTFSKEVIEILMTYSPELLEEFYKDLIPKLKALKGADVQYVPMYPNFPKQVMEAPDIELLFNAMVHYLTFGIIVPEYEKDERIPLKSADKTVVLSSGAKEGVLGVFQNILASKTAISPQDSEDVEKIVEKYENFYDFLPDEIPLKENAAIVAKIITDKAAIKNAAKIQKYFKTPTDVLRYIVALSDGDISLASSTKFKRMKRSERRMVMDLLAGCDNILEDFYRYKNEWIRIGEIVHPGTYKFNKYKDVRAAFQHLREEHKPVMLPREIHEAIEAKDTEKAVRLLKKRPGEFARSLDKVLRDAVNQDIVIDGFASVADDVSSTVLLQLRQHFLKRNEQHPIRVFFPKGQLAKVAYVKNELPEIEEKHCEKVVEICETALRKQYEQKEPIGKVFIDEEMKNYIVPFSQRSASKSNKTVVRGSALPINVDSSIIRGFIWWTNTEDNCRVDVDLSASIFDENWKFMENISYTNLRSRKYNACHSGDIVNGGHSSGVGVAEFIDIDINNMTENNARYVVFQVYNFTGVKYSLLKNCRFGWMERDSLKSGEIFEPSTVNTCIDLTSESCVAVPVIFDCVKRKFIWCDMVLSVDCMSSRRGGINLESNMSSVTATCYAMVNMNKTNMYDLIELNAEARGEIVHDRAEADIIFSNDRTKPIIEETVQDEETGEVQTVQTEKNVDIITAYDLDYFMGQLL